MAWIVFVDGNAIGPFALEADADARAEAEVRAREAGCEASVTWLAGPDEVEVGGYWQCPFVMVFLNEAGEIVEHHPFGKDTHSLAYHSEHGPNLDNVPPAPLWRAPSAEEDKAQAAREGQP